MGAARNRSSACGPDLIERARSTDLPQLAALEALCFSESWSHESLLFLHQDEGALLLVAHSGTNPHELHAYCATRTVGDQTELLRVAVDPSRRRQGLGHALVEAALADAFGRGAAQVLLEVRSNNLAARNLYRSFGFEEVGIRPHYYADGTDALVLRLAKP